MLPHIVNGLYSDTDVLTVEKLGSKIRLSAWELNAVDALVEDREESFTAFLSDWLQFYGPRTRGFVSSTLGLDIERLESALEALIDSGKLVSGRILEHLNADAICDARNFEILLRMMRADARPVFEARDIEQLQLFLARLQGITNPDDGEDGLFKRLEQLVCWPAPAESWESEIFPARLKTYDLGWLDSIMSQSDLLWIGNRNRKICFSFEADLDLIVDEGDDRGRMPTPVDEPEPSNLIRIFPDLAARYDFSALLRISSVPPEQLNEQLWRGVWRSELTNDTFTALRRGIENRFKVTDVVGWVSKKSRRRHHGSSRVAFLIL
jgi:ATP-dependent Lhr-like helicase